MTPLSRQQLQYWIDWRLDRNNPRHNTHIAFEITGAFNPEQFLNAFNTTFKQCPVFHTCFCIQEGTGTPYISIKPHDNALIEYQCLEETTLGDQHYLKKIVQKPLDLLGYPNFRAFLFQSSQKNCHYFVAIFPHILMDATSCQLLLNQLANAYNNAATHLKLTNGLKKIAERSTEKSKTYWKDKLLHTTLNVALNQQCYAASQKIQKRVFQLLNAAPVALIKQFSRENKTTPFLVLLSLFAVILYRYTNQTNFSILYPVDLREKDQRQKIGCYSNLIPLCINIDNDEMSLENFIGYVKQQRKQDRQHQNLLFSELCEIVRTSEKRQETAFNVGFSQTLFFPHDFHLKNADVKSLFIPNPAFPYDIGLLFDSENDKLALALDYRSEKFHPTFAKQLLRHLEKLINTLPLIAKQPIKTLNYMREKEKKELLEFSNANTKESHEGKNTPLYQLKKIIYYYSEKNALTDALGTLSYRELQALINQIINFLKNKKILRGDCVAILLNRDRYYIGTLLALTLLRCPYVPLELELPLSRVNLILQDAGCKFLITENTIDTQGNYPIKQLVLGQLPKTHQTTKWDCSPSDNEVAYIVYTSGTTGKPKGVPTQHNALSSLLNHALPLFRLFPQDRWSLSHSLAFDFSVWEIWGCFLTAAELIIIPTALKSHPKQFYEAIANAKITVLCQTPSAFKAFMAFDKQLKQKLALRYVIFGGEKLEPISLTSWIKRHDLSQVALINMYGLTESPIHATFHQLTEEEISKNLSNVGKPLPHMKLLVLDKKGSLLPTGCLGEINLAGGSVTTGYLNRPEINRTQFVLNELIEETVYKTGDYGWWTTNGELIYVGRKDDQIKHRGHRIELSEIHYRLQKIAYIDNAVTILHSTASKEEHLITFCVVNDPKHHENNRLTILNYLASHLPKYMLPTDLIFIKKLPLTNQGKINTEMLRQKILNRQTVNAAATINKKQANVIESAWKQVLALDTLDTKTNFFDLGGNSITLAKLHYTLERTLGLSFPLNVLFEHPTVIDQVHYFSKTMDKQNAQNNLSSEYQTRQMIKTSTNEGIAIVGMAVNLPKALCLDQFWENLINGVESITHFSKKELLEAGIEPTRLRSENYVRAKGYLEKAHLFDADFFGFNEKEAAIIDPQQRLFLTCCWLALEDAGWVPENFTQSERKTGVFGSQSQIHPYFIENLLKSEKIKATFSPYQLHVSNAADFLCSRVAYKLGLTGPSMSIQTGCSASLVAVCEAAKSLFNNECDLALAGGSTISMPVKSGYAYQSGMILSKDGHCRAFDKAANGTVPSNGVAVVALKRISDAMTDRNRIYAVIKSFAVNNDGSKKMGFTTPSQSGQAQSIKTALERANIEPCSIDYIEAHGTGTKIGDPIELAALDSVLPMKSSGSPYCIGSLKTNLGHLDVTAGVAGLIKTALCLYHKKLPPSLHFKQLNDSLTYGKKFKAVDKTQDWESTATPRRAGVSAFAIGGTNAHVILEESRFSPQRNELSQENVFIFSAKTPDALAQYLNNFSDFLKKSTTHVNDIAFTLQTGRCHFPYRFGVIASSPSALADAIRATNKNDFSKEQGAQPVCFVFAGQGTEYANMGKELYQKQPCFKKSIDECAALILALCQKDIRALNKETFEELNQLCIFAIEYALAKTFIEWGIVPDQVIGYSLGELVALCIAGAWTLKEALAIVYVRQSLMKQLPQGKMLSVALSYETAKTYCNEGLSVAAINTPRRCVLSGSPKLIDECEQELKRMGIACQIIPAKHAYHSADIDTIVPDFISHIEAISFKKMAIPVISTVTGTVIDDPLLQTSGYWTQQLREPVLFHRAIKTALEKNTRIFIEMGSEFGLCHFIKQIRKETICLKTLRKTEPETVCVLKTLRDLWLEGQLIRWESFNEYTDGQMTSLPTYCFNEKPHWVFPDAIEKTPSLNKEKSIQKKEVGIYQPIWPLSPLSPLPKENSIESENSKAALIIFPDKLGITEHLCKQLKLAKYKIVKIHNGKKLNQQNALPTIKKDIERIEIIHIASLNPCATSQQSIDFKETQFIEWMALLAECADCTERKPIRITWVTNGLFQILGNEVLDPEKGLLLGSLLTLPQENTKITAKVIDIFPKSGQFDARTLADILLKEIHSNDTTTVIAYRHLRRFTRRFVKSTVMTKQHSGIKTNGVYLITGGLGHIGLTLAKTIASQCSVNLLLLQRRSFPEKSEWKKETLNNDIKKTLSILTQIEQSGSQVTIIQCDIANSSEVNAAVSQCLQQYKTIDGIIHAAGIPAGKLIANVNHDQIHKGLAAKVSGIIHLHNALKTIDLDFMVLCSALSAIHGDSAQSIYNAANAFLDSFACWRTQSHGFTISINWDAWKKGGMAYRFFKSINQLDCIQDGLDDSEAAVALLLSLSGQHPQLAVSHTEPDSNKKKREITLLSLKEESSESLHLKKITEEMLTIWKKYLGEKITPSSNYFDLGGDSLLAVQMAQSLSRTYAVNLEPSILLAAPTVDTLSQKILQLKQEGTPKKALSPIVTLKKAHNEKQPVNLFLVHPIGGTVYIYKPLADALAPEVACYSIQTLFNGQQSLENRSVEHLATDYLKAIQPFKNSLPCYLGGFSFGGVVAYEMAQQCYDAQIPIAGLFLIDTPSNTLPNLNIKDADVMAYLLEVGTNHYVSNAFYAMALKEQFNYFIHHADNLKYQLTDSSHETLSNYLTIFKANLKAAQYYQPLAYRQATLVHYFKAAEQDRVNPPNPECGWEGLISQEKLIIHKISGNHLTMMEKQHSTKIANIINKEACNLV